MTLRYRSFVDVDALALGECTMHRAHDGMRIWWQLWFRVQATTGAVETFVVPMNPGGPYIERGPGGKTWGLTRVGPGVWQVSPSINVLASRQPHPGAHSDPSLWHQTPQLVEVPEGEAWAT